MLDVQDQALADDAPSSSWVVRGIYAVLIGANLWIAFDWWRDTDQGRATIARAKAMAAQCEGCARRKAWLAAQTERMHRQARQIVEGDDAEVHPEPPAT